MSENKNSRSDSYKAAGVDITAGYKAVELMKAHIARTMIGGADAIGGFGGLFELDITDMPRPVLVSGTDGVGTKLKLAFLLDKHDTVGIDCVAMCANDILCCGAKPLFFLDYIACGKNVPERIASIVAGRGGGLRAGGLRAGGRRNRRNAGLLPGGRVRHRGFLRGRGGQIEDFKQGRHAGRRRGDRAAIERRAL